MDPFVAEIRIFPFNFAPKGWAMCNGQLLPISQNTALFSLLGTTYGGDGKSNFALPNLQGSVPLHVGGTGPGPGLSDYSPGQQAGAELVTLDQSQMPPHTHVVHAELDDPGDVAIPSAASALAPSDGGTLYQDAADTQLSPLASQPTGGDQPHNNLMPLVVFNFCIALQGVYPPRS
jgi:microcystin-dependent protein